MPLPEIKIFFDHIHLTKLDSFDLVMGMFNAGLLLWLFTLSWTGWIGTLGTVEVDVRAYGNVANRLQGRWLVFDVQKS